MSRRARGGTVAGILIALAVVAHTTGPTAQQSPQGAAIYQERCAACHDSPEASRAPSRESLSARPTSAILAALAPGGIMADQGQSMSNAERQAVATYLSSSRAAAPAATAPADPSFGKCGANSAPMKAVSSAPAWNGWGNDASNARFQDAAAAGLSAADVPKLTLKWAFGFPGATSASAQPAIVGGRVFVGNETGWVYSLDAATGCTHWSFKASAGVRTAMTIVPKRAADSAAVLFGDLQANVYALDATTGAVLWKTHIDEHPHARISGAPAVARDQVIVPVSSFEEFPAARPDYPCCTFRGSIVSLDMATGKVNWKTYMIPEAPVMIGKNAAGTPLWKPAGVAIWNTPTIDTAKNLAYVGTGNAYTQPAPPSSDAVVALDLKSGAIVWMNQLTPNDAFVVNCKPDNLNCPKEVGPDHDFGQSPILRTLPGGRRLLLAGQKSGVMYALDPDNKGAVVWQFRAGKGGMLGGLEWGSAADDRAVYIPVSDVLARPNEMGGLFAVDLADGSKRWHTPAPPLQCAGGPGCAAAQSAAVTVIPGVVFSGSVDGHLRAYSTADGKIVWDFDTAQEFETVNGVKAAGGSIDAAGPVVAGGLLLTNSGYGRWRGKPGNVLLAFAVP